MGAVGGYVQRNGAVEATCEYRVRVKLGTTLCDLRQCISDSGRVAPAQGRSTEIDDRRRPPSCDDLIVRIVPDHGHNSDIDARDEAQEHTDLSA
jgi:hypothetical protein